METLSGAERWVPYPRNRSDKGAQTIRVCGLNRAELIDLYTKHIKHNVRPEVDRVERALLADNRSQIWACFMTAAERLLHPFQEWTGLAYDALNHFIPNERLARWYLVWPNPPFVRWSDH